MINKVILVGNVGADPESPRKTPSGLSVLDISLATTRKGKDGVKITDWHTVTCFGATADNVHKFVTKGRQVCVEGRLQYDSWDDEKTGQKRKKAKIVADSVTFLGGKEGNMSTSGGNDDIPSFAPEEDIPF